MKDEGNIFCGSKHQETKRGSRVYSLKRPYSQGNPLSRYFFSSLVCEIEVGSINNQTPCANFNFAHVDNLSSFTRIFQHPPRKIHEAPVAILSAVEVDRMSINKLKRISSEKRPILWEGAWPRRIGEEVLVVSDSNPLPYCYLDLFSVVLSTTRRPGQVNSERVGILSS